MGEDVEITPFEAIWRFTTIPVLDSTGFASFLTQGL